MKPKANKFYAYLVEGGESGVAETWDECEAKVSGREARYRGFPTRDQATAWLEAGARYEHKPKASRLFPEDAVFFDSGTGGSGITRARVTDRDGVPIAHLACPSEGKIDKEGSVTLKGRSNNYGELYACHLAIKTAIKLKSLKVYGDSRLVLEYWSRGFLGKAGMANNDVASLAALTADLRVEFESLGGTLEFVSGDINPADLGFHKPSA